MTIFVDPYHTSAGVTLDMTRVVTPLKECTVRDSLSGTNLGVRSANGIVPVFITGSRDSEIGIPAFTHPILIKNFNTKSYLFTDVTLFVSSGATLSNIDTHIRRREEFQFTKTRAIASLAWASGEVNKFQNMPFVGEVFATWMGITLAKNFALTFVEQTKVQLIALAFYYTLFADGPRIYSQNTDEAMLVAKRANNAFKTISFTDALAFYKTLETPMLSIHDFCHAVVESLDNVTLNPVPGRPDSGFNFRVLLNLIADSWYSTNSKQILAVALEHPPTLAAIIYYCANYNNFKRQQLGMIIQQVAKGGKGTVFDTTFRLLIDDYLGEAVQLRPVMEYLTPGNFLAGNGDAALDAILQELNAEDDNQMNKVAETSESNSFGTDHVDPRRPNTALETGVVNNGGNNPSIPAPLNPDDVVDGRPIM